MYFKIKLQQTMRENRIEIYSKLNLLGWYKIQSFEKIDRK